MENTANNDNTIRCPNLCFNGLEKTHDYYVALYDLCKCKFCRGKGYVKTEDFKRIEKLI